MNNYVGFMLMGSAETGIVTLVQFIGSLGILF